MVGFGKTIWSRKVGETEFGLKAIPLGGYIRMIGMIPPAKGETLGRSRRTGPFQGLIDDARQQSAMDVLPEDAHRQFYPRAPWKRIIVMFAGPFMNLILAVVLFAIVLMGIGVPTELHDHGQRGQRRAWCPPRRRRPSSARRTRRPPRPPRPGSGPATRSSRSTARRSAEHDWRACRRPSGPRPARSPSPWSATASGCDLTPTLITTELPRPERPGTQIVEAQLPRADAGAGLSSGRTPAPWSRQIGDVDRPHRAGDRRAARRGCPACSARRSSARSATQTGRSASSACPGSAARSWPRTSRRPRACRSSCSLLAAVNISLFLFNLLPHPAAGRRADLPGDLGGDQASGSRGCAAGPTPARWTWPS